MTRSLQFTTLLVSDYFGNPLLDVVVYLNDRKILTVVEENKFDIVVAFYTKMWEDENFAVEIEADRDAYEIQFG